MQTAPDPHQGSVTASRTIPPRATAESASSGQQARDLVDIGGGDRAPRDRSAQFTGDRITELPVSLDGRLVKELIRGRVTRKLGVLAPVGLDVRRHGASGD